MRCHVYDIVGLVYDILCDFLCFVVPTWAGSNAAPQRLKSGPDPIQMRPDSPNPMRPLPDIPHVCLSSLASKSGCSGLLIHTMCPGRRFRTECCRTITIGRIQMRPGSNPMRPLLIPHVCLSCLALKSGCSGLLVHTRRRGRRFRTECCRTITSSVGPSRSQHCVLSDHHDRRRGRAAAGGW